MVSGKDLYGKWLAEGMLRFETCEIVSIKSFSGGPHHGRIRSSNGHAVAVWTTSNLPKPSPTLYKLHPFWASCQFVIRACLPRSNGQSCRTWKRAGSIEIKPSSISMGYVETLCGDHWWFWPLLNYKRLRWCRPHCLFTHQSANPGVITRDCCAAKQPIETQKNSPHQELVPTCCLHFSNAYETHLRDQFPPQWARSAPWQRPTQSLQALETEDLQTSKDEVRSTVIEALGSSGLYVDPSFIRNWRQPSTPQVPRCLIIHALLNFVIHWWISKHVELIWQKICGKNLQWCSGIGEFDLIIARFFRFCLGLCAWKMEIKSVDPRPCRSKSPDCWPQISEILEGKTLR